MLLPTQTFKDKTQNVVWSYKSRKQQQQQQQL